MNTADQFETYLVPEHIVCYLFYGDCGDLSDAEIDTVDRFCADVNGYAVGAPIDHPEFSNSHALIPYGWLADTCVNVEFRMIQSPGTSTN